jgi:hypothetical protein
VWIVAESRLVYTLELPDQKARGFLISTALEELFPEHVRKVFGEMTVRT